MSVLTVGEIRRGIELKRRRDDVAAHHLDLWLEGLVTFRLRSEPDITDSADAPERRAVRPRSPRRGSG